MRVLLGIGLLTVAGGAAWLVTTATAQPPGGPPPGRGRDRSRPADIAGAVEKMMTFDSNKDGTLTKEEVTDTRLVALFESADANQDGKVSADELTAQLTNDAESLRPAGPPFGGPPGGGPEGDGRDWGGPDRRGPDRRDPERWNSERRGPERRGPGGFGGPGGPGGPDGPDRPMGPGGPFGPGFGGPPPIGQVLPGPLQEMLKLSPVQRRQIEGLQRNVDRRISEILTEDQLEQLEGIKNRGPMGPGGPMGPDGPRGPRGRGGPPERDGPRDREVERDRERPRDRRDNRDEFNPPPRRPAAEEER